MMSLLLNNLKASTRKSYITYKLTGFPKRYMTHSPPGSGAGKGGGAGGAVKEGGGGMGRYGAAQEEGYFYNKSRDEIEKLKKKMKELEEDFHNKSRDEIEKLKKKMKQLEEEEQKEKK